MLVSLDKYLLGCLFSAICNNFFRSQILNVVCFFTIFFIKAYLPVNLQLCKTFFLECTNCTYFLWTKQLVLRILQTFERKILYSIVMYKKSY
jgi:hypothetical protein